MTIIEIPNTTPDFRADFVDTIFEAHRAMEGLYVSFLAGKVSKEDALERARMTEQRLRAFRERHSV